MRDCFILTDTHLGVRSEDPVFLDATIKMYDDIAAQCVDMGIDTIFHLGDFFDDRHSIGLKTIEAAKSIASIIDNNKITHYIIVGNHDCFYKNKISPTSLSLFNHKYIKVVSEPLILDDLTLVPWGTDLSQIYPNKHLFGHLEIDSFPMNDAVECKSPLKLKDLKKFEQVLSGHFHMFSNKANVTYIGSTFQQTFNDVGHKRGYYFSKNDNIMFVESSGFPKFVVVRSDEDFSKCDVSGNIVKLIFTMDYGNTKNAEILEHIEMLKPLKLHIDFSKIKIDEPDQTDIIECDSIRTNKNHMVDYINKVKLPEHLKKKVLLDVLNRLTEGVNE